MKTKTAKTYDEFIEMVTKYNSQLGANTDTGWKYGQVFFNVLDDVLWAALSVLRLGDLDLA